MTDQAPIIAAFVLQTALLVVSLLLCRFFWVSDGPMVTPFTWVFSALSLHVGWHLAVSVLDILRYVPTAEKLGDAADHWLFLSHGPLTVTLIYLLWRLSRDGVSHGGP